MLIFAKKMKHMKRLMILCAMIVLVNAAFPQMSLSYKNNALVAGDSVISLEFQYTSPGGAGPDQIWDFSKIQYSPKYLSCNFYPATAFMLKDAGNYNVVSVEDGYTSFINVTQHESAVMGYYRENLWLIYSDALVKMRYPFSYGDHFIDPFAGNALANEASAISFDGENIVTADAYGTLVLPDRMIRNTLRVKTEKNAIELRPCSTLEAHIIQYCWYAPGYRYPVLIMVTKEYKYNGEDPATITQTAYICLQQTCGNDLANVQEQQTIIDNDDFAVVTYPNPFDEQLTYGYFIRSQMPVTIGLYDISGKLLIDLKNSDLQTDGIHTGIIDAKAHNLKAGVYYIRFTFDKKSVVNKIVKL
jgi:hypothetical protein